MIKLQIGCYRYRFLAIICGVFLSLLYFTFGYILGSSYFEPNREILLSIVMTFFLIVLFFLLPVSILAVGLIHLKSKSKSKRLMSFLLFGISLYVSFFLLHPFRWYVACGFTQQVKQNVNVVSIKEWLVSAQPTVEGDYFSDYELDSLPEVVSELNPRYVQFYNNDGKRAIKLMYGGVYTGQFGLIVFNDSVNDIKEIFDYEDYIFKKISDNAYVWVGKVNQKPFIASTFQ
ncbi:MAG: hypothetical protein ACIAQZ_00130 [Sedimentisphaeraceae bacterium JB056]